MNTFILDILGLQKTTSDNSSDKERLDGLISMLVKLRSEAKIRKDYASSDEIRDKLSALGVMIKDTKEGCEWEITNI